MLIGLTQRVLFHKNRAYDSLEHSWYSCLKDHKLVAIPNTITTNADFDLLIVTGGNNHPSRDKVESNLVQQMIEKEKPIIGICHGAFMLTALFGGKICKTDKHMDCEHHVVADNKAYIVNSYHTLQIENPPPSATILATDYNGYCESWIYKNIGAIVWHPERMDYPFWPNEIEKLFT